jgi:hypothetical protein
MIFWRCVGNLRLVIKLSYVEGFWHCVGNLRLVIKLSYVEGFWLPLEDFLNIIFLHGEIFEFP